MIPDLTVSFSLKIYILCDVGLMKSFNVNNIRISIYSYLSKYT